MTWWAAINYLPISRFCLTFDAKMIFFFFFCFPAGIVNHIISQCAFWTDKLKLSLLLHFFSNSFNLHKSLLKQSEPSEILSHLSSLVYSGFFPAVRAVLLFHPQPSTVLSATLSNFQLWILQVFLNYASSPRFWSNSYVSVNK